MAEELDIKLVVIVGLEEHGGGDADAGGAAQDDIDAAVEDVFGDFDLRPVCRVGQKEDEAFASGREVERAVDLCDVGAESSFGGGEVE